MFFALVVLALLVATWVLVAVGLALVIGSGVRRAEALDASRLGVRTTGPRPLPRPEEGAPAAA